MKEFNGEKFCKDIIELRGTDSQSAFAEKLGINRSTLSLLENGKQIPTLELFNKLCNLASKSTEEYFKETTKDSLVYLMGSLDEADKVKIEEMAERIRIKEKYERLAKRSSYVGYYKELFEHYYQKDYDFNTSSLSAEQIKDIKQTARQMRVDYALAPMGTSIFNWILNQNSNIRFELVPFDSENIDGMLYVPTTGKDCAYIILNVNKPLINQIFTAAHEFYHYIKDYKKFRETPYICDFNKLKDINEMCASRFAAELLLPEEALLREIKDYLVNMKIPDTSKMTFHQYATLMIFLTVKYQMPLKAVIYRLAEEGYIKNIEEYIKNYEFIKNVLREIEIFKKRVEELYKKENNYVLPYSSTYVDMERAFSTGNASREEILEDAKKLELDMKLIDDILAQDTEEDDEETDDEELFALIRAKRG